MIILEALQNLCEAVARLICNLRGHDSYMVLRKSRMFMRCHSCNYKSGGWDLR